jgi:hypothetical protein
MPKRNTGVDEGRRALLPSLANLKRMSNLAPWAVSIATIAVGLAPLLLVLSTGMIGRVLRRVMLRPETRPRYADQSD